MALLENDQFLLELDKLYSSVASKGNVTLTFKSISVKELNKTLPKDAKIISENSEETRFFIRALGSGKQKIRTFVTLEEKAAFLKLFYDIVLSHMSNLKKRKRASPN